MTKRSQTSEQLGQLGEELFTPDCTKAGIVCNPVRRDRYGWDVILEFGPHDEPVSFDKRPAPISCHVQVKTIWSDNDTVKVKLSAIQRLAQEPKPALVVVNKIDKNLVLAERIVIHLLDAPLAKVLERLRRASAEGKTKLNSDYVYFDTTKYGQVISSSPLALRRAIETAVGPSMQEYIEKKREQFKSLGYTENAVTLSITTTGVAHAEFLDGMLGLRQIPLSSFRATETRFDIPLPIASVHSQDVYMTVTPKPRPCVITARAKRAEPSATLNGEFIGAALPGRSEFKGIIKGDLFEVTLTGTDFSWRSLDLQTAEAPIDTWLNFFRFCRILSDKGTLRLEGEGLLPLELPYRFVNHTFQAKLIAALEKVCTNVRRLEEFLGVQNLRLTLAELKDSANDVANCLQFADNRVRGQFLRVNTERQPGPTNKLCSPSAYFSTFPLGPLLISYCVLSELEWTEEAELGVLRLAAKEFKDITIVRDAADFEEFANRQMEVLGVKSIVRNPSDRLALSAEAA